MATVSEIMSTDVQVLAPQQSLRQAARLMQRLNVGALPVCDGRWLLGMLTDRDMTVRAVSEGLDTEQCCVSDVMSVDLHYCTSDQDAQEVMKLMGARQIRRLPVVDHDHRLVGIVSLGDLALRQHDDVARTLRRISAPADASAAGA